MLIYGNKTTPEYNLENIDIPVYMFVGNDDILATPNNVNLLNKYFLKKGFVYKYDLGHAGFLWAKDMSWME